MKYLNRSIILFLSGSGYFGIMFLGLVGIDEKAVVYRIILFNCLVSGFASISGIKSGIKSMKVEKSVFEYIGIILNAMLLSFLVFVIASIFIQS